MMDWGYLIVCDGLDNYGHGAMILAGVKGPEYPLPEFFQVSCLALRCPLASASFGYTGMIPGIIIHDSRA